MAVKIGKLIKKRFFHDDSQSGNYFDLAPIFRNVKGEDEAGLNNRIMRMNKNVRGSRNSISPDYMCTLMLTPAQIDGLSDTWKDIYSGKSILMTHDWKCKVEYPSDMYEKFWEEQHTNLFRWSEPSKVYVAVDGNGLNFRYAAVSKKVVDAYEEPEDTQPAPIPGPSPDPGPGPEPGPIVLSGKYHIYGDFGSFGIWDAYIESE